MDIVSAEFVKSAANVKGCPAPLLPEYAFIGRSNVGKSSLINMLVNRKALAKTSAKPGKTQLINHFKINDKWFLADLPGYGYAKVSKSQLAAFDVMIRNYLTQRPNLMYVFVLIDSRLEPQAIDLKFVQWLGENNIPVALVFTKADKAGRVNAARAAQAFGKAMLETWEALPAMYITSSETKQGRPELLQFIEGTNGTFDLNTVKEIEKELAKTQKPEKTDKPEKPDSERTRGFGGSYQ